MNTKIQRIEAVNDFVIKFANVNGSGSASANELFAKAILRMGVPVSPRNIFPSNIQGMPTWYEARVCEKGYHGRRGGVDMMVAMNPQTWDQDVAEIESGGYLFYDSTRPMPASAFRPDINVIGMPVTAICNATYEDPRQRTLFKNIMVLGALSALIVGPCVAAPLAGDGGRLGGGAARLAGAAAAALGGGLLADRAGLLGEGQEVQPVAHVHEHGDDVPGGDGSSHGVGGVTFRGPPRRRRSRRSPA